MRMRYELSEAFLKAHFIRTGARIDRGQWVEFDEATLSPDLRAALVEAFGMASDVHAERPGESGYSNDRWKPDVLPADVTDPAAFLETYFRWRAEGVQIRDAYEADRQRRIAEHDAEEKRHQEQHRREEAERKEAEDRERRARAEERAKWIAAHGSDFLRKAVGAGYDCQRRYVTERAALEYPGFEVDFDDGAEWKPRSCPSEAALDASLAVGEECEVVWLTCPVGGMPEDEDGYPEEWEPREALAVREFLGKYDLVKML
jgi:hypothetical protein